MKVMDASVDFAAIVQRETTFTEMDLLLKYLNPLRSFQKWGLLLKERIWNRVSLHEVSNPVFWGKKINK